MSFLRGVADDGPGSAAQPSRWRPDRIPRRTRNLALAMTMAGTIAFFGARAFVPTSADPWLDAAPKSRSIYQAAIPTPSPTSSNRDVTSISDGQQEYAIATHELRGLSPDTQPGTTLHLWVAWDPSFVKGPQVQRLLKNATLSRFIESVTPSGPTVAILAVPSAKVADLMYGDLYGRLSVSVPR